MDSPFVIPPWTPPELLVSVRRCGSLESEVSATNGSLCNEPGTSHPPKPEPISKPFVAGMLSMAWASLASSLSKQGSPSPIGTFLMTHVTVPPMLSFLSRYVSISLAIRAPASSLGQRTGRKESTVCRSMDLMRFWNSGLVAAVGYSGVGGKRCSLPTDETKATISTLRANRRYFSAMAPAATRPGKRKSSLSVQLCYVSSQERYICQNPPIVSRALLRPPPLLALTPYFCR